MMMKSFGPSTLGGVIALMAVALSTCAVSHSAHAQQVITTCGPSTGMQYSIAPDENKWTTDGVKNGSTTFLKDKEGEYDIVIKHWGGTMTAREDGAKVILTHGTGGRMTFVVVYPLPTVEVYQLTLDSNGRGTLLWSSLKGASNNRTSQ